MVGEVIHRLGYGLCFDCPTRDVCTVLCDRVESWVNVGTCNQPSWLDSIQSYDQHPVRLDMDDVMASLCDIRDDLTCQQYAILCLLVSGRRITAIARQLGISHQAVRDSLDLIRKKLKSPPD